MIQETYSKASPLEPAKSPNTVLLQKLQGVGRIIVDFEEFFAHEPRVEEQWGTTAITPTAIRG